MKIIITKSVVRFKLLVHPKVGTNKNSIKLQMDKRMGSVPNVVGVVSSCLLVKSL